MKKKIDYSPLLKLIGKREAKFVGLVLNLSGSRPIDFGQGPVAEFEHTTPCYSVREDYPGHMTYVLETHFRLNLTSVRTRIKNLKLPKNYGKVPWTLIQEHVAEQAILSAAAA